MCERDKFKYISKEKENHWPRSTKKVHWSTGVRRTDGCKETKIKGRENSEWEHATAPAKNPNRNPNPNPNPNPSF